MILYFSGTGNSKYAAEKVAELIGDEPVSLNALIKAGDSSEIDAGGRLVIATPTYAWRIPNLVRDWIEKTPFVNAGKVWFVMTCGSEIGNADRYNRALCEEKGFEYMGTLQVRMPENYLAMFPVPGEEKCREIIAAADPVIKDGAELIAGGKGFPKPRCNGYDRLMSGPVNKLFYKTAVKPGAFRAEDKCIGCGLCEKLCPTNSIRLEAGRPVWSSGCTHCMACISHCPKEAIEYGNKSKGKPRYHID